MFLKTQFTYLDNDSQECSNKPINMNHVITYNTFVQGRMGRFAINFRTVNEDVDWFFNKESDRTIALNHIEKAISQIDFQEDIRDSFYEEHQY